VRAVSKRSRSSQVANTGDHDVVAHVVDTSALGSLLFFTDAGKAYKADGHEIPKTKLTAAPNLFQMSSNEQVVAVYDSAAADAAGYVVLVTAGGQVKAVAAGEFTEAAGRRDGLVAAKLSSGDRVAAAILSDLAGELVVATREGQGIRFSLDEVRPMGRSAAGVRAIKLKGQDEVAGACVMTPGDDTVLVATSGGYAKRTRLDELGTQRRGGSGLKLARLNVRTGQVVGVLAAAVKDAFAVVGEAEISVHGGAAAALKPRESGGSALEGVEFKVQRVVAVSHRPTSSDEEE
jgi:DNA gyrase subunit A